jgi:2-oxoglutarate ferredoxin oxidoreductase subunit beta
MALASMSEETFPVPIGVFRNTVRPAFELAVNAQVNAAKEKRGEQDLQTLLDGPDTWKVG